MLEASYVCRNCIKRLKYTQSPSNRNFTSTTPLSLRKPHAIKALRSRPPVQPRAFPKRVDNASPLDPKREEEAPSKLLSTAAGMQKPSSNPISSLLSSGPENTSLDPSIQHNLYLDTFPPSSRELKKSSEWFAFKRSNPKFLTSVAEFRNLPISNVPEVAFVGRSNVGKSSLLNAMVGANFFKKNAGLAQTSKRPGCTKTMNLYGIGGARLQKPGNGEKFRKIVGPGGLVIVDLPGYGKGGRMEWGEEIIKFFVQRKQLRRVFVLLDSHIGMRDGEKNPIKQNDRDLLELLRQNGVSHQVILSKIDGVHIPEAKKLRRLASRQGDNTSQKITPKDGKGDLHLMMKRARDVTKPARGGAALGEVLGVSSELEVDGNLFGMNGVRVAVLRAVGIEMGKQSMGDIQVQEDAQV